MENYFLIVRLFSDLQQNRNNPFFFLLKCDKQRRQVNGLRSQ